ncbi:unnamed protein product, partial [Heterosigma akashiwo]
PFGLKDSPYSFMMLMNATLGSAKWAHALSFIDDLVIYSKNDWGLHLQHLQDIFTRLTKANLRLKVSKCKFAAGEIKFLGHIVGRQGLRPDPQKVEAVSQLARPDTKKQVRRFLGMTGYYRNMIKDFSTVAGPLHSLTKKIQPDRVKWTPECEKAFISLKKALTSYPVLRLPDMRAPFILECDASKMGIGAALTQEVDGQRVAVAYASRLNNSAQRNYSVFDLEMLAVVFGFTRYRCYCFGSETKVLTDHS